MTLVFNEPREGPATHALIIGVEDPGESRAGPYSAAVTAHRIADLLLRLDIAEAPLASIDLHASYSPHIGSTYQSPRDGYNYHAEPPILGSLRPAVQGWRQRLAGHADDIAIFYYVGPVAGRLVMKIPANRPDPDRGVQFEELWDGMAVGDAPRRQLYFVEGCPGGNILPGPAGVEPVLRLPTGVERADFDRALFEASFSGPKDKAGGWTSLLYQSLVSVLQSRESIAAEELGDLLDEAFEAHLRKDGHPPGDRVGARSQGEFMFRYRLNPAARAPAKPGPGPTRTKEPPAPEPTEEPPELVAGLDPRHRRMLRLVQQGKTSREIASELHLSSDTVDHYVSEAIRRLGVSDRRTAAKLLAEHEATGMAESDVEPATAASPEGASPQPIKSRYAEQIAALTDPQRVVLRMVYDHLETKEIARDLGLSPDAVDKRIQTAMKTLGVNRRRDAARIIAEAEVMAPKVTFLDFRPGDEPIARMAADAEAGAAADTAENNTHFVDDDPEVERDELNRGPLAIALGRRLHRIWCRSNGIAVPGDEVGAALPGDSDGRSAFVLHLDAPWGGGKTSFANFLARVLNPFPAGRTAPAAFLTERADGGRVGTIFIDDPPGGGLGGGAAAEWPRDARRPWIVVTFNAWQAEHCAPPWWVFYQAIRKGCVAAIVKEGSAPAQPGQACAPEPPCFAERFWSRADFGWRELSWRLRNPKVLVPLCTASLAGALILILLYFNVIFRGDGGAAFNVSNVAGFLLSGVTGIGSIWGAAALFTESMAPGTDTVAERRSLGSGDPLERFRRHFSGTIAAVRRPVMVIVDDLDRCRPDFVVDLVRGIQTLLRSPRVVFVILGDRDWIERAFESHHETMSEVNVGTEQSFGARFVEKAIQMSFILPRMPDANQDSYVRRVLLGPGADAGGSNAPAPAALSEQLRADYRQRIAGAETTEDRKAVEEQLREDYRPKLEAAARAAASEAAGGDGAAPEAAAAADEQAGKLIGEERALLAAVDERMGKALLHRLEPLARFFPPNPRQIKRIVNAITMYTCVAYLQMDMDEDDSRGIELAIWVIVMTEWPETWRLLASCPRLADVLAAKDMKAALAALDEGELPGSRASTLKEAQRIRADRALFDLITHESEERPRLSAESVAIFADLTPLYSRKRRLADDAAVVAPSPRVRRRTGKAK